MKHWTHAASRAVVVPLVLALPACSFERSGQFTLGDPPRTSAVFCDVEADRHCSSADERLIGIDLARANEDGFWAGKSSRVGLDYSPQALAACGGQPQAVLYQDAFPNGTPVCVNPNSPGSTLTTNQICQAFCFDQGWIDTQGNAYGCNFIAWHSRGAEAPFAGACTDSGTLRPDFQDPRRVRPSNPVTWTAAVGVTVAGSDLTKIASAGWGNAGAISTRQLAAGDGAVLITASETNTLRIFGLGNGNTNASFDDVEYGLVLTQAGNLLVCEPGNNCARVAGPYQTSDELEVGVVGNKVHYKRNGTLLYESPIAPSYPLLMDAALNFTGATLKNARTTF